MLFSAAGWTVRETMDRQTSSRGKVPISYAILSLLGAIYTSHGLGRIVKAYHDQRGNSILSWELPENRWRPSLLKSRNWAIAEQRGSMMDSNENDCENVTGSNKGQVENYRESMRHLLVDLHEVPRELISSVDHIEVLMKSVAGLLQADLAAHSCTGEVFAGRITCVGFWKSMGHISIHAWPNMEVPFAILDVQFPEDGLIDMVEHITAPFHSNIRFRFVPEIELLKHSLAVEASTWLIKSRGWSVSENDLATEMSLRSVQKFKIVSVKTAFQQVDVVEFQCAQDQINFEHYREKYPSYIDANPLLFKPDRMLFLDGTMQSTLNGNAAYHESLVQPSMFAHPNPRKVAIIGGGECATLREVLKHNTVEKVVMIDIDPGVIEISKYALPEWNDCSNLEGSSRYCMDDPRAEIYNEDAFKWFMDRYLGESGRRDEPLFDVIIMDALDPQNVVDFAKALYGEASFLQALYQALSPDGILITQVGEASSMNEPTEEYNLNANRVIFANSLAQQGFQSIADYENSHAGFEAPWSFYAAFKDVSTRTNWMASEAEINVKIRKRATRTIDGSSPFDYFDGATMRGYQFPTRASVNVYCRRRPVPPGCIEKAHGFDPDRPNYGEEYFGVNTSFGGEYAGLGVFSKSQIPVGSYLMLERSVYPVTIEASSVALIEEMNNHKLANKYGTPEEFILQYVTSSPALLNGNKIEVESGILTFVNRACDNLGRFPNVTGNDANSRSVPNELRYYRNQGAEYVFNPAIARGTFQRAGNVNLWRHIQAGEELFENYYEQYGGDWEQVETLQKYCGGGMGEVSEFEKTDIEQSNGKRGAVMSPSAEILSTGKIATRKGRQRSQYLPLCLSCCDDGEDTVL